MECLLDEEPRKPALRAQSITQIIPAHETVATFGRRDIDADGTIKKQIAERIPVICWALVADDEFYVMGMVAQESGEIILVNQREDFLEYETAASGTLEMLRDAIDKYIAEVMKKVKAIQPAERLSFIEQKYSENDIIAVVSALYEELGIEGSRPNPRNAKAKIVDRIHRAALENLRRRMIEEQS